MIAEAIQTPVFVTPGMARSSEFAHRLRVNAITNQPARQNPRYREFLWVVELENGTKFRPSCEGLRLLRTSLKISRSLRRDAQLCDFSPADRELLRTYGRWNPGTGFGQLSNLVCTLARRLI